jgi:tetratricopeptide (TPR) repeat protein
MNLIRLLLCAWLATSLTGCLQAADPVAAFESANRLYEEGRYREAAEAYAALAAEGRISANLCFNLGNAWFKAGELGRAIVSYRLAARLAPRDPDIEANLRMTRELVSGAPPPPPAWWRRLTRPLALNEWAGLTAVGLWICGALMVFREARPRRERGWPRWLALALATLLLSGMGLLGAWFDQEREAAVVVTVPQAVVRYGPLEVSPQLQVVQDGVELTVLDRKDDWLQVSGLLRGTGWLNATNVTAVPR